MKKYFIYLFIGILFFLNKNCIRNNENITDYNRDIELSSVITDIYLDTKNHHLYRFSIKGIESDFYAAYYINSWKYANIGDSIIKKKGEDFIEIKKKRWNIQNISINKK